MHDQTMTFKTLLSSRKYLFLYLTVSRLIENNQIVFSLFVKVDDKMVVQPCEGISLTVQPFTLLKDKL